MSKQQEIQRLVSLLESLSIIEIRKLRKRIVGKTRGICIPKTELEGLVRQNKSTRAIAQFFKTSPRTITRRIKAYGLKDLRPKGRKQRLKHVEKPKVKAKWISMRKYFQLLNQTYRIVNIKAPPKKWINPKTLVASNTKGNPEGEFTTVGIYYIVEQSNVHLLYTLSIRYSMVPVPFEEIYGWISSRVYDIVFEHAPRTASVVDVVALTFEKTVDKPEKITVKQ